MNNLLDIYELIDISSSSEEEGEITRSSTPIPSDNRAYPGLVIEILNSSAEANADEEECLDLSVNSLETECKKMKLSESFSSFETVESGQYPHSESTEEVVADSPESPDESLSSDIFIVEAPAVQTESVTSSKVAEYLEKVQQEDASSYFVTPPGPLRRINLLTTSPLNDLEEPKLTRDETKENYTRENHLRQAFDFYQPGKAVRPMTVALSQSAPGLDCGCRRVGFGRGHGCTGRLTKRYFGY